MSDDVTMQAFHDLIEKAYALKSKKEEFENQAEIVSSELSGVQAQLLEYMDQMELTSHKTKFGNIIRVQKMSVKTPKDPEQKAQFFAWLESKGIKDDILSVNSKTLNAMYNAEMESAKAAGKEDFSIPGIEAPTMYQQLQMRK